MEKTCANHPESLALATCKACEKSICLMCVQDEKEGTFCSTKCVNVFREVSDWVDPGNGSAVAAAAAPAPAAQPSGSIFDPEPPAAASSAPAAVDLPTPPAAEAAEFEPLVTPGTKWRMIGAVCASHADTPAVATCEACDKTVCSLCVVEAENGTFCTTCAAAKTAPAPRPIAAAAPKSAPPAPPPIRRAARRSSPVGKIVAVVVILGVVAGAGYFFFLREGTTPSANPNPDISRNPAITRTNPDSVKTNPVGTNPTKTNPVKTDPIKTDPVKTDPVADPPVEPRVTRRPDPPPRIKLPGIVLNPWAERKPGSWYRMKMEKGGKESYGDLVLKERDVDSFALTTPAGEVKTKVAPYWVKGEASLTIDDQKWLCEIREFESPPSRRWVLIEGRNAGAVLKEESEQVKMMATRLWAHEALVGRRTVDCLVVEGTVNGQPFKQWFSASLPVPVKMEMGDTTTTLVGLGDDASARPPLPKQ